MIRRLTRDDPVAVIGAGTMGAGIAQVAAAAGHAVLLYDAAGGAVEAAVSAMAMRLDRSVERGRLHRDEAAATLGRIRPVANLDGLAPARLVVEAIVEDLGIKQRVLADVASVVAPDAIIATNTSSLSVTAIASGVPEARRVAGLHFFNPAPVLPLVEVVHGAETDPAVVDALVETAANWGKTPVRCASTPGFIVNRVARPFYGEALRLLEEGVSDAATIDACVTGAGGFRMGPFALMDLVGLDVNLAVSTSVYEQTAHDPRFAPSVLQRAMVDAGRLGRKTGSGWFAYAGSVPAPEPSRLQAGPTPSHVEIHGDLGWAAGIVERLRSSGVEIDPVPGGGPGHLIFDGVHLVPTDGTMATSYAASGVFGAPDVAVFDLVRDWSTVTRIAVAVADQAGPDVAGRVAGLFTAAGLDVAAVDDAPGLVLMRIVAQLASVAADAVRLGVAAPGDVDTAMRLGTSYPAGPLEWGDAIGAAHVVAVLDHLAAAYGEDRYRASLTLRRAAASGDRLRSAGTNDPDPR
jgi:3-hydroxybutyryl-CoA dehydrogenase